MNDHAKIEACAEAAHEVNRVYCAAISDTPQPPWRDAPDWQKESARKGVLGALSGNTPEQSHEGWLEEKRRTGWAYGTVKDTERKTHPCLVPYADLPPEQRAKDRLYLGSVRGMAAALGMHVTYPASPGFARRTIDWSEVRVAEPPPSSLPGWTDTAQGYVLGPWRIYQTETWCVGLRADVERLVARGFDSLEKAAAFVREVSAHGAPLSVAP